MSWLRRIGSVFSAAAFAEAGEYDTALIMVGTDPESVKAVDVMTAITFAEAGFPDLAREYLGPDVRPVRPAEPEDEMVSIDDFLRSVGLGGCNYHFGVAKVA